VEKKNGIRNDGQSRSYCSNSSCSNGHSSSSSGSYGIHSLSGSHSLRFASYHYVHFIHFVKEIVLKKAKAVVGYHEGRSRFASLKWHSRKACILY